MEKLPDLSFCVPDMINGSIGVHAGPQEACTMLERDD